MKKRKIILASGSPRRKNLLEQIGLDFEIMPSAYEENMNLKMGSVRLVEMLAWGKAKDIAEKITEGIVIGADTLVVFQGKRIGKPTNKKEAREILEKISGGWVTIHTGLAIIDAESKYDFLGHETTKVKLKELTRKEIEDYIETGEPMDKAGAFAIQGKGAIFVEMIKGCHTNVIGLPLHRLYLGLKEFGIEI